MASPDENRNSFARQGFMATLGASLELVETGRVHIGANSSAALTQQHGYVHGGVITSIVDSACGYAALTMAPSGSEVLTVEFKISFLAPAIGSRFVARANVMKAGRRLSFCTGEVAAISGSDEQIIATMLATMMTKPRND